MSKPPPPKASQTLSVTHSLPIVGMRRRDGGHLTDIREDVVKTPESGQTQHVNFFVCVFDTLL